MTENAIKFQELEEKKRSNKVREKQNAYQPFKDIGSGVKGLTSGAGSLSKLVGTINDASWYTLDKQMVKDTCSISFNNPLGAPFKDAGASTRVYPGIFTMEIAHTLGDANAILHAAQNIYAYVRHANSGSRNYQPNDLISYLLSMSDVYSYHSYLCRLYSLLNTAKGHNRYYFNAMITAAGGNPLELRKEISQLRAYINSFAVRANAYFVPKDLTLFQRRYWLYANLFKDKEIRKSQVYLFKPYCLGIYDDTSSTIIQKYCRDNSSMSPGWEKGLGDGNGATLSSIREFGDNMLNALLNSADIGIMAGDILKAYGESNMYLLPSIPEEYHVEAIFSEEVLSQIHNCIITGEICSTSVLNAKQFDIKCPASGGIQQGLRNPVGAVGLYMRANGWDSVTTLNNMSYDKLLLNMYKDDVSPDEVIVATRLSPLSSQDFGGYKVGDNIDYIDSTGTPTTLETSTHRAVFIRTCGTEIVVVGHSYTYDPTGATLIRSDIDASIRYVNPSNPGPNFVAEILDATKYDWHPIWHVIFKDANDDIYVWNDDAESANYASVSLQTLKNIHYTAIISEYGVPLLGIKVRSRNS